MLATGSHERWRERERGHTLVHIDRIRNRMDHSHQRRNPRDPLMEHMKRPIRPAGQPDQKVVPPRQEEEDWHIPQRQHARTIRNQLAPVDLQRGVAAADDQEDDVDEPVAGHQQRLHSSRERVPPDWLSVSSSEERGIHQPPFEGVRERTRRIYPPC